MQGILTIACYKVFCLIVGLPLIGDAQESPSLVLEIGKTRVVVGEPIPIWIGLANESRDPISVPFVTEADLARADSWLEFTAAEELQAKWTGERLGASRAKVRLPGPGNSSLAPGERLVCLKFVLPLVHAAGQVVQSREGRRDPLPEGVYEVRAVMPWVDGAVLTSEAVSVTIVKSGERSQQVAAGAIDLGVDDMIADPVHPRFDSGSPSDGMSVILSEAAGSELGEILRWQMLLNEVHRARYERPGEEALLAAFEARLASLDDRVVQMLKDQPTNPGAFDMKVARFEMLKRYKSADSPLSARRGAAEEDLRSSFPRSRLVGELTKVREPG